MPAGAGGWRTHPAGSDGAWKRMVSDGAGVSAPNRVPTPLIVPGDGGGVRADGLDQHRFG